MVGYHLHVVEQRFLRRASDEFDGISKTPKERILPVRRKLDAFGPVTPVAEDMMVFVMVNKHHLFLPVDMGMTANSISVHCNVNINLIKIANVELTTFRRHRP